MVIQRKGTPPSSAIKKEGGVLGSLSAWTDSGDPDDDKKQKKDQARELGPAGEPTMKAKISAWFDTDSDGFNMGIGLVIILNSIVIGLETEMINKPDMFKLPELIFFSCFFVEACLRIKQNGIEYFKEPWNDFDFFLVMTGTFDLVGTMISGKDSTAAKASVLRLLRILKLLRILRVIRLFRMFHQLYLIMQAFNKAFQIVALMSILVIILDYVCGIIVTQGIGYQADLWEGNDKIKIDEMFGSISRSMQTMFVIMTLSEWDNISALLCKKLYSPVVHFGLVLYIMITSYTMISLISGIISESLITSQQEFKQRKLYTMEQDRKELTGELKQFLTEVHEDEMDDDQCVEGEDLKTSIRGDTELLDRLTSIGVSLDEKGLLILIDKLCKEGKERINIGYFVEKLTHLNGTASASTVVDLHFELIKTQQMMDKFIEKTTDGADLLRPQVERERRTSNYTAPTIGKKSSLRNSGGDPTANLKKQNTEKKTAVFAVTLVED